MRRPCIAIAVALSLALAGGQALAQAKPGDAKVLPVWNHASGKVEAYLVLEPTARWQFGKNSLETRYGLEAGDSLALLCDRKNGLSAALGNLANHCMLATLDANGGDGSRRSGGSVSLFRGGARVGVSASQGRDSLPAWLTPAGENKVEVNDLALFVEKNVGRQGYVAIGGTVAKAKLMSPAAAESAGLASDQWNSRSLALSGGIGRFGANIVGHVVDAGDREWQGFGVGFTWRTPWSGQLSIGADKVVTKGKNPFAAPNAGKRQDDGTVPYVKYQQDL